MSTDLATRRPEQELITRWHEVTMLQVAAGDFSKATADTYRRGMDKFMSWALASGVDQVSADVIQGWKAEMRTAGRTPSTINTWYAGVRNFFSWAVGNGLLSVNPTANVKGVKRKGTSKRHLRDALTDTEILRVLEQPDRSTMTGKRDYALLCLMAFGALRTIEIHRADLDDLSTVDGLPVLRLQGKGSAEKDDISVVAHPRAQEALYDWLAARGGASGPLFSSVGNRSRGKRLGVAAIRYLVKGYYKSAGIVDTRKTTHSLRHSAISKVARHNVMKARQVARHASLDTTMIYVHENDRLSDPGEQYIDYVNGNGK